MIVVNCLVVNCGGLVVAVVNCDGGFVVAVVNCGGC